MQQIKAAALRDDPSVVAEVAGVIRNGGLVCLPCGGSYRLLCDPTNSDAVMRLMQLKQRTRHKPSLIFVPHRAALNDIADEISSAVDRLATAHWPGPLTILVRPGANLPKKVKKTLTQANKHIGVRIPADDGCLAVVREFGAAVLASSANREKKVGADSGAHVRRTFGGRIDVFVDAGELKKGVPSTVVSVDGGEINVTRPGALPELEVRRTLADPA